MSLQLRLLERLGEKRRVLDLGCGSGAHIGSLAAGGAHWVGVDRMSEALAYAEHRRVERTSVARANLVSLPFAGGSFDGILVWRVLCQLPDYRVVEAMSEVARVASMGALVVFGICEPSLWSWPRNESDLRSLLEHVGLCVESVTRVTESPIGASDPDASEFRFYAGWAHRR